MKKVSEYKSFGGWQIRMLHFSEVLKCEMHFSVFLPPIASKEHPVPVIYWLSGLTCNDENFVQKAGAQAYAAKNGVAIVVPDTSPRGDGVPDDSEANWDFGLGAGFYLDALVAPWSKHYNMYSYIVTELPSLVESEFPVSAQKSIMGHSMGGHGALTIALKHPESYTCVSAFAPICAPMQCAWGQKAFKNYLGDEQSLWENYDACSLLLKTETSTAKKIPIWIEQGGNDQFLLDQLKPELLQRASLQSQYPVDIQVREGYDHSYFFIASFIGGQIARHANSF